MQDPHIIECNIHKCLLQVIRQKCKNLDCKEGFICKHFCENVFLLSELGTKTPLSFENDFVCSSSKIGNKSSQQNEGSHPNLLYLPSQLLCPVQVNVEHIFIATDPILKQIFILNGISKLYFAELSNSFCAPATSELTNERSCKLIQSKSCQPLSCSTPKSEYNLIKVLQRSTSSQLLTHLIGTYLGRCRT